MPATGSNAPKQVLGPNTLVPLGSMLAVMLTVISSVLWISSRLGEFRDQLVDVGYRLRRIEEVMERDEVVRKAERDEVVRKAEMRAYLELLRARNPDDTFPEFR